MNIINRLVRPRLPTTNAMAEYLPPVNENPERILIISDVHANWLALEAVLKSARGKYDGIWFLGDLVGYGPHPQLCVEFFIKHLAPRADWVAGNHEVGVISMRHSIGGMDTSNMAILTWQKHRNDLEGNKDLWDAFLDHFRGANRTEPGQTEKFRYIFVHANPHIPDGDYIWPDETFNLMDYLKIGTGISANGHKAEWLFVGHSHMVFLARWRPNQPQPELYSIEYKRPVSIQNGRFLINPGSVGQPRDGDTRAAYAILNKSKGVVTFYRAEYAVDSVLADMVGYPNLLTDILKTAHVHESGHWERVYSKRPDGKGIVAIREM